MQNINRFVNIQRNEGGTSKKKTQRENGNYANQLRKGKDGTILETPLKILIHTTTRKGLAKINTLKANRATWRQINGEMNSN